MYWKVPASNLNKKISNEFDQKIPQSHKEQKEQKKILRIFIINQLVFFKIMIHSFEPCVIQFCLKD
jgi:heme/copper-type cytochrome/quinol oxidase subunit 3